jgi:L,D-peptidoglycan transpeptidase YkuD (ErfK/YbiS/YcfS/YnhG family)
MQCGSQTLVCSLGKSGLTHRKREGDKATPAGRFAILYSYYRPDRLKRPRSALPLKPVTMDLGWCDAPDSPLYNRPKRLPLTASHERMWRSDGLYDLVFVLDYNLHPRRAGRGSAIFLHCAKPGFSPTLGCLALRPDDLRRLLPRLSKGVVIEIV